MAIFLHDLRFSIPFIYNKLFIINYTFYIKNSEEYIKLKNNTLFVLEQ